MIYFIALFGFVIITTISFIAWAFSEYSTIEYEIKKDKLFNMPVPIIERAYRAVDLRSMINYVDSDDVFARKYFYDDSKQVVHNEMHKKVLIEKACYDLTKTMINDGFVQIVDHRDKLNPYQNTIEMRVKVYKPEL